METLNVFYEQLLEAVGASVDPATGFVSLGKHSLLVENKRLALPYKEVLDTPSPNVMVFHPAWEVISEKEHPALMKYRQLVSMTVNMAFYSGFIRCLNYASDVERQKTLSSVAKHFVAEASNALAPKKVNDAAVLFSRIYKNAMSRGGDKAFVNIIVARGAMHKGERIARLAFAKFDVYHQIMEAINNPGVDDSGKAKKTMTLFDVEIRLDMAKMLVRYYENVFPELVTSETGEKIYYVSSVVSSVGITLEALLRTFKQVADCINIVTDSLPKEEGESSAHISVAWYDRAPTLSAIESHIRSVPVQSTTPAQTFVTAKPATPTTVNTQQPISQAAQLMQPAAPVAYQQPQQPARPRTAAELLGGVPNMPVMQVQQQPAFGAFGGGFGVPQQNMFGNAFGVQQQPAFGAFGGNMFGVQQPSMFGASNGAFGGGFGGAVAAGGTLI